MSNFKSRDISPEQVCLAFSPDLINTQIVTAVALYKEGSAFPDGDGMCGCDVWTVSPLLKYRSGCWGGATPAHYLMPIQPDEDAIQGFKEELDQGKRSMKTKCLS